MSAEGSGVRRYRMSYRDGIREDDGTLIWPADASKPMVLAEQYDTLSAERDALREGRDMAVRLWTECGRAEESLRRELAAVCAHRDVMADRMVALATERDALTARVAQLESALRDLHDDIVERFDMLNPSTNVGLVNAVEAARAALRGAP